VNESSAIESQTEAMIPENKHRLPGVDPRHYFSKCDFQFRPRQPGQVCQIRFPRVDQLVDGIDLLKAWFVAPSTKAR